MEPRDQVPPLDADGTCPARRDRVTRAKLDEVERELRAQVERALAIGIKPTHLDSHMGALFSNPQLFGVYAKVARSYRLPFLTFIGNPAAANGAVLQPGDIVRTP